MQNMGVRASLTISLVIDNQLWGLIACHHNSPRRVGHLQRLAYEALGQQLAVRLRAAELASVQARRQTLSQISAQVVAAMASADMAAHGAAVAQTSLLGMVAAEGVVLEIEGERISAGKAPAPNSLDALLPYLAQRAGAGPAPWFTDTLAGEADLLIETDLPIETDAWRQTAAGVMYLPLPGHGCNFVAWFRSERAQTVRWAGRVDLPKHETLEPLQPRASFSEWIEQVRGRSLRWRRRKSRPRRNSPRRCRKFSCTGRKIASRSSRCTIR